MSTDRGRIKYPRKEGKKRGLEICARQIKSVEDYQQLQTAIQRYSRYVKNNGIELKFVKHFSSFVNNWTDWLDPNAGTVKFLDPPQTYFDQRPPRTGVQADPARP